MALSSDWSKLEMGLGLVCPFSSSLFKGELSCPVSRAEIRRFHYRAWAGPRSRLGETVSTGSGSGGGLHRSMNPGGPGPLYSTKLPERDAQPTLGLWGQHKA